MAGTYGMKPRNFLSLFVPFLLLAPGSQADSEQSPGLIQWQRIIANPGNVTDLSCRGTAVLTIPNGSPITLQISYQVKQPDKARLEITARLAPPGSVDYFDHKVGFMVIVNGSRLSLYSPFTEGLLNGDLSEAATAPQRVTRGSGAIPFIEPYVQGMLSLAHPQDGQVQVTGTEVVEGRLADVLEIQWPTAIKPLEPHTISRYRYWIERERSVPLRAEALNTDQMPMAFLRYGNFQQVAPERWVPLAMEIQYLPGQQEVTLQDVRIRQLEGNFRSGPWPGKIPYPGRKILQKMEWMPEGILVPREAQVLDHEGHLMLYTIFTDYQFNTGLPDSLFEFESPQAK